ncbi:MAG: hemolysin family protein [Saprospiraceae bacterium]
MVFDILLTLLLVFLNGFFVAAEFAIVKVRSSQLEIRAKAGNRFAKLGKHIVSHLDGYLAATQLGITLASLGLGWIGESVVAELILKVMDLIGMQVSEDVAHSISLPIAFAIITVLHIVFGELSAFKSVAIQYSEKTTLFISYPLQFFYYLFRPFIWVLNGFANLILKLVGLEPSDHAEVHSSDELKFLVAQGKEAGEIGETDYDIIKNAFNFSDRRAFQVMTPRNKILALDINDYAQEDLEQLVTERFSRIPCYEDKLDQIKGILYTRDLLASLRVGGNVDVKSLIHAPLMIPKGKRLGSLLKEFQSKHLQMAIVVNEYGGTEGLVTMEDILEELVGEIQDEFDDEQPFVQKIGDNKFACIATANLDDINEFLPYAIEKVENYETLAGILISKFNRIPDTKEEMIIQNYKSTVVEKEGGMISLVHLEVINEEPI